MGIKWEVRSGNYSDDYCKARFGHLRLAADEIDGDNQPYSIYLERVGRNVPVHERYTNILRVDAFFGGLTEAKKRVEYLARCFFYGIPPEYTDWERDHAEIGDLSLALQRKPATQLHGVWIRGIYYHPTLKSYIRIESVANVDSTSSNPLREMMGAPTVVFKDVFTDRLFARTVADFNTLGFKLYSEVEDNKDVSNI